MKFDKEADALTLQLNDLPVVESNKEKPSLILDCAEAGLLVFIESLNALKKLLQPEKIEDEIAS